MARADRPSQGSLGLRTLSALVMAPLAIAVAWFGWPWLPILTAAASAVMAWEWARLCCGGTLGGGGTAVIGVASTVGFLQRLDRLGDGGTAVISVTSVAVIIAAVYGVVPGVGLTVGGAVIVWAISRAEGVPAAAWLAAGVLWIGLPCVLLLWLAPMDGAGRVTLLWIFAVVWSTDIGAYAIGRQVGGPLLAPQWSPRKTWSGLIGGAGCAALAGWSTARILGGSATLLMLVSAGLAIVEQFGDLAESVAKRRFGVKDSSGLIPGHGGLLDRLDGLLAVIPAVALLTLTGGGGVLTWR